MRSLCALSLRLHRLWLFLSVVCLGSMVANQSALALSITDVDVSLLEDDIYIISGDVDVSEAGVDIIFGGDLDGIEIESDFTGHFEVVIELPDDYSISIVAEHDGETSEPAEVISEPLPPEMPPEEPPPSEPPPPPPENPPE